MCSTSQRTSEFMKEEAAVPVLAFKSVSGQDSVCPIHILLRVLSNLRFECEGQSLGPPGVQQ